MPSNEILFPAIAARSDSGSDSQVAARAYSTSATPQSSQTAASAVSVTLAPASTHKAPHPAKRNQLSDDREGLSGLDTVQLEVADP